MFQEEYNVFQTAEIENPNGIPDREKVKYNRQVWQESKNQGGMKILKSGEVDTESCKPAKLRILVEDSITRAIESHDRLLEWWG